MWLRSGICAVVVMIGSTTAVNAAVDPVKVVQDTVHAHMDRALRAMARRVPPHKKKKRKVLALERALETLGHYEVHEKLTGFLPRTLKKIRRDLKQRLGSEMAASLPDSTLVDVIQDDVLVRMGI